MTGPTDDDWKKMSKLVDSFYNRPDSEPFRAPVDWKSLGLTDYPELIKEPMDLGTVRQKLKESKYQTFHQTIRDVHLVWTNCLEYNAPGSDFHKLAGSLQRKWDDKITKLWAECSPGASATQTQAKTADSATTTTTTNNNNNEGDNKSNPATGGSTSGGAATASSTNTAPGGGDGSTTTTNAAPGGGSSSTNNNNTTTTENTTTAKASVSERRNFAKALFNLSKEDLGRVLVDIETKCPMALQRNATEDEVELNVDKLSSSTIAELQSFIQAQRKKKAPSHKKQRVAK